MIHPRDARTDGRAIANSALSINAIFCRALKSTVQSEKITLENAWTNYLQSAVEQAWNFGVWFIEM